MEPLESVPRLVALPASRARQASTAECLLAPGARLDNAAFAGCVDALAARLADLRVSSGDVVAVLLPNRLEVVVTMFAAWHRGAAITPVNPTQTDDEIGHQLRDSDTAVIVGDERGAALAALHGIAFIDVEDILRAPAAASDLRPLTQLDDHALIIYTSGTTGRPKGCVLDHANIEAMVSAIVAHCELSAADRSLCVMPLFHVNGLLISTLAALAAGGSVYVQPRFDPATFWDAVADYWPTYFSAVPTMYALLEANTERQVDTSSIRLAICGAAPMAPDLLHSFEERFGLQVVEGYGLAETTVAVTVNPIRSRKPGTVGPPLPGQTISIVNPFGDPLPDGTVGEVVVYGPNVMRGYLGRPEETAKVLRDGWLHTGDLGYLDEDGFLVLVDRIKDLIIRGGEHIYPKELEDVLHAHDDVLEACVIGRPDDLYGEVPVAYVVPRPGRALEVDALREFCLERLAKFKVPREINVLTTLPKNASGKILKPALRAS
ncbi:MAG: class I adenylate-forming enzyme family protein [Marmoricola sp.]